MHKAFADDRLYLFGVDAAELAGVVVSMVGAAVVAEVVAVSAARVAGRERASAVAALEQAFEQEDVFSVSAAPNLDDLVAFQPRLNLLKKFFVDDAGVLGGDELVAAAHLPDVDGVGKDVEDMVFVEPSSALRFAAPALVAFGAEPHFVDLQRGEAQAVRFQVCPVDGFHDMSCFFVGRDGAVSCVVAQRLRTAVPKALACTPIGLFFGAGADDLALELRER
ncbi:MAG: hypothetical protein M5U25_16460 [Planctomycetota bacterium]|nr:hypothetical protein [Planctomycetota bacterium]